MPRRHRSWVKYTLSLTSALDGVGWLTPRPAYLPPEMIQYRLYRSLGGPQGRSTRVRKISPPTVSDPRTVQPVTNRYTDYGIPRPKTWKCITAKYCVLLFCLFFPSVVYFWFRPPEFVDTSQPLRISQQRAARPSFGCWGRRCSCQSKIH